MQEFTLNKREDEYLKVNIGEESFNIPLVGSLTPAEAQVAMESIDGAIAFFNNYIRADVAERLTIFNYRDLVTAWKEASEKVMHGEVTPGES